MVEWFFRIIFVSIEDWMFGLLLIRNSVVILFLLCVIFSLFSWVFRLCDICEFNMWI